MTNVEMYDKLREAVGIMDMMAEMFRCSDIDLAACQEGLSRTTDDCRALITEVAGALKDARA